MATERDMEPIPGKGIFVGVDASGRHPAAIFAQRTMRGQLQILRELVISEQEGLGAKNFSRLLRTEMETYFPSFNYLHNPYVCPAVLFGTKNVFPIEEYVSILNFIDKHPNIFKFGDMGFLNYLLFKLSKENKIRLGS